ncbi:MAG TPA: hypothetical protein ENG47_04610 [Candidatus Aerophobetes bacterium]|uniref:Uncharacterized protein n=1 Tax=Aerophobetes bacterium TaxID=2030807 RepID=A0A662DFE6_UNCAE|nr:MAG: hypothetical protein DRI96_02745 [Candidatus Aerophobetes bacterium]HDN85018.1 hypothetical protein [Candidatus Aerophobetes bacterium]
MIWRESGVPSIKVGGKYVPVKTLFLKDKWGQKKRFRVQTILNLKEKKPHYTPAWAQLARDSKGKIGAIVAGAHSSGWIRVGSSRETQPYIFVSLDALPKKVRKKLLVPLDYELIEEEGTILAKEKKEYPWYVGNLKSRLFHEAGCWQAKRIKSENKIIFKTKKEAFKAGYTPHKLCGG